MTIGLFSDTYLPDLNGVATATKLQKDILTAHGHTVYVITTGLKGQKKVTFEDNVLRIPGLALPFLYNYRMAFLFNREAYKILQSIPFDVLHVQSEFGVGVFGRIVSKVRRIPLVYTYHTSYEGYTNYITKGREIPERIAKKAVKAIIKAIAQQNAEIVTPSAKAKKMLRDYGVDRPIAVIPNPIELPAPSAPLEQKEKEEFLSTMGLKGKRIVLWLGRVAKEKNIEESIDFFLDYKRDYRRDDVVMLIVGDGPDRSAYVEKYQSVIGKDIFFLGKVEHDKTPFFYGLSDVFLSSSTTETQGLTFSEAISAGCIVLARYDFNLEGFIEDGITGFLYDEKRTMEKKIDMILKMDETEKECIRRHAKKRVGDLFSRETYYERIRTVYGKAIRKGL